MSLFDRASGLVKIGGHWYLVVLSHFRGRRWFINGAKFIVWRYLTCLLFLLFLPPLLAASQLAATGIGADRDGEANLLFKLYALF